MKFVRVKLALNYPETLVTWEELQQMMECYLLYRAFALAYMGCTCELHIILIKIYPLTAAHSSAFVCFFYTCSWSGNHENPTKLMPQQK